MNAVLIDAGNTNIKLVHVVDGRWSAVRRIPVGQAQQLAAVLAEFGDTEQVWVSNVAGPDVAGQMRSMVPNLQFIASELYRCGVHNGYGQPAQLGSDRWAALIAAWHHAGRACLVVSCGTATTIDALNERGEFVGGLILPGIELMQRSLTSATAGLQPGSGHYADFPRNTPDAMLSGAIQATCGAVQRQYAMLGACDAPVLLCGGASGLLHPHLTLPVEQVDNLVLKGLWLIAQEANRDE